VIWALIVFLCLLFTALLCIPLQASIKATAADSPVCAIRIAWLYGLIVKNITVPSQSPRKGKRSGRKPGHVRIPLSLIFNPCFRHQFIKLLRKLSKKISVRRVAVDLRIGIDDPADTWVLTACAIWITLFVHPPFRHSISIQPDFTDEFIIIGTASGDIELMPIQMIVPIMNFMRSSCVLKPLVNNLWKRNN